MHVSYLRFSVFLTLGWTFNLFFLPLPLIMVAEVKEGIITPEIIGFSAVCDKLSNTFIWSTLLLQAKATDCNLLLLLEVEIRKSINVGRKIY